MRVVDVRNTHVATRYSGRAAPRPHVRPSAHLPGRCTSPPPFSARGPRRRPRLGRLTSAERPPWRRHERVTLRCRTSGDAGAQLAPDDKRCCGRHDENAVYSVSQGQPCGSVCLHRCTWNGAKNRAVNGSRVRKGGKYITRAAIFLETKRCRHAGLILALRPHAFSWFSRNFPQREKGAGTPYTGEYHHQKHCARVVYRHV